MKKGDRNISGKWRFLKNRYFYFGLLIFVVSIIINCISTWYLLNKYPGKIPVLYDLILNNIPYLNIAFLYDLFGLSAALLLIIFILHKNKKNEIGYYFLIFGLFYIVRGVCISLTPIGNPADSYNQIFNGGFFSIGTFPSGHVGTCFLAFLFSKGIYRHLIGLLTLGVIAALLFSKGHYSIDIIGAIIFSYAIYAFGEGYLKKKFVR